MNTRFSSRNTTASVVAFFAAAAVTTAVVGSQFGLAQRYEAQAQSLMAGQAASKKLVQRTTGDQPG
jgi:hypothetical protein